MIFAPGTARRTSATIRCVGAMHQRCEFVRRQHACPGIEDLHRIDAGLELANEIVGRRLDQDIDQPRERLRMAIGEQPRRRLIRRAVARDHVGRNRPGRAAEAEKRHLAEAAPL